MSKNENIDEKVIKNKKISIESLLSKVEETKSNGMGEKNIEIKIDRLEKLLGEGVVVAKIPNLEIISSALVTDKEDVKGSFRYGGMNFNVNKLVYNCLIEPDLSSKELRKAFGVKKNIDVFTMIFKDSEVTSMMKILMEKYGSGVTAIEKVKN